MALAGDFDAMVVLGSRYLYGDGEKKDLAESERWYRMAAVRRDFDGAHGMGTLYVNRKDYVTAYAWFALYADEDAGLRESKDEVMSIIPKSRKAEAVQAAKRLKEIVLSEQAELLRRHVKSLQNK
jgi:TPR repeat protein